MRAHEDMTRELGWRTMTYKAGGPRPKEPADHSEISQTQIVSGSSGGDPHSRSHPSVLGGAGRQGVWDF